MKIRIFQIISRTIIIKPKGGKQNMKAYYPRKSYRVSGYKIGNHAIKRMRSRGVTKSALRYNLTHKPLHISKIRYNNKGRPSYLRYSRNKTVVAINPNTKHINTTWKYHTRLMNKFLKGGK